MRFSEFVELVRPADDVALSEMPPSVASVARWALEDEELRLGGAVLGMAAGEEMCALAESMAVSWQPRSWG